MNPYEVYNTYEILFSFFKCKNYYYSISVSRKKFAQLSRMFTRGGSRRAGGAKAPSRGPPDSLLLQEEHSDDEDRLQHNKNK